MNKCIETRAYQALVRQMDNEIKVVEAQYEKEFARVCMLIRVIAETVPNPPGSAAPSTLASAAPILRESLPMKIQNYVS